MRKRILGAAGVAAVSAMVAMPGSASAVANGLDVAEGQFEFAAKLTMTGIPEPDGSTRDSACSGSLIAEKWIISAGHCFHDNGTPVSGPLDYDTSVLLGSNGPDTEGVTRNVVRAVQSPIEGHDVALAELDKPVTGIEPLKIADQAPVVGDELTLAGWGSLTGTDPEPSDKLQQGVVEVSSVKPEIAEVRGVAPHEDTSACTYDSGAPYFVGQGLRGRLVSVESDGPGCPHSGAETTARVDVIADWIHERIDS